MQDAERLTHRGIFKCLAFKCYLKGIFYYAYMHADTNSLRLFKVAILGLQTINTNYIDLKPNLIFAPFLSSTFYNNLGLRYGSDTI